jgi:hypothetical protein
VTDVIRAILAVAAAGSKGSGGERTGVEIKADVRVLLLLGAIVVRSAFGSAGSSVCT